jgi:uncharacterized RDD family membrane protein YckC
MLVLCAVVFLYFVATESGPYAFINNLIGEDDQGYLPVFSFLLTFLALLMPPLVVLLILRPFSDVPAVKARAADLGPLTSMFKNDVDTTAYGELPSVFSRVLAFIIDRGIVVFIIAIPAAVFVAVTEQSNQHGALYFILLVIFLVFLCAGIVYSYSRDMFGGKSLARRLLKQKVVDVQTGAPIGGWRSFKRELVIHFAPLLIIEMILISANKDRRRIGDTWAKTIVVKDG